MWLRLTERAKKAVAFAQSDARLSADKTVIACLSEHGGLLAKALEAMNIDAVELQKKLDGITPDTGTESDEIIDAAEKEARGLACPYIGPEHLLLGILKMGSSQSAKILSDSGLKYENLRAEVELLMSEKTG